MSAHLQNLTKQIRGLPFPEMVEIATKLCTEIQKRGEEDIDAFLVANALIAAVSATTQVSDLTANEEKIFRKLFARKRTIAVSYDGAWTVDLSTVAGAAARGTELRSTLSQMLDAAVTIHILTKD
jgi:sulfur relay (sulfurtransferase) complex TusBCD TusD component (DsrE family)